MHLASARALKHELDDGFRQRNALMEKFAYQVSGLGEIFTRPVYRPPLAKGIVKLGPRDYGLALRVYEGMERHAGVMLKSLSRYANEVQVAHGVTYRPRAVSVETVLTVGSSIGHYRVTAGTLGGFVRDGKSVFILSNNHVLANMNDANRFDPITLPGRIDVVGGSFEVVAYLHGWLELQQHNPDGFDAAIALLDDGRKFRPSFVPGVGRVERLPVENRYGVHGVFKCGRTTKLTRGIVTAFELDDVMVNYGTPRNPNWLRFDNQIEFGREDQGAFSKPGDSGSVIYQDSTRQPYALLFAGGPDATGRDRTLGHYLPDVLEQLGVEMM